MWSLSWSCNIAALYPLLSLWLSAAIKMSCATERLTKRTEPFHALAGLWHAHLFLRKMLSYCLNCLLKIFDVFTASLTVKKWYCSPSSAHPCWFFCKQQLHPSFICSEACVGATCLSGGVSTVRGKVVLQKGLNRAISHIQGRHAAPVINLNQFIAHHWLPLFYFKFPNQIKVKEAKDERRGGKGSREKGEARRKGEAGQGMVQSRVWRRWAEQRLEGWGFRWAGKENGLVFWVDKSQGCCLFGFLSLFIAMYGYCFYIPDV